MPDFPAELRQLAEKARVELNKPAIADRLCRALAVLRRVLGDMGFQAGADEVQSAVHIGLPGVVCRRAIARVQTSTDGSTPEFQVGVRLFVDWRSTGETPFSVVMQFEARSHHELTFLLGAQAAGSLDQAHRFGQEPGPMLSDSCLSLMVDGGEQAFLERQASLFCLSLNDRLTP